MTIVGEAWVAIRPDMAGFDQEAAAKTKAALGPAASAGMGTMAKLGMASTVALGAVAVTSLKLGEDFQSATAKLAGQGDLTIKKANDIGQAFLNTAGHSTFSGRAMLDALTPVAGQLEVVAGHALSVADATKFMASATDLAEASGYGIGLDGHNAAPPSDMDADLAERWAIGYAHGYLGNPSMKPEADG